MYLCFDIGGTRIKGGVLDAKGQICARKEVDTHVHSGVKGIVEQLKKMEQEWVIENPIWMGQIKGIGIGVPGVVEKDRVRDAVNLGWKNEPLTERVQDIFTSPVYILNDANAAALGELWLGGGRGFRHLLCVTVGTGIGAGVIVDGTLHLGKYGMAGEIGHFQNGIEDGPLCSCGNSGCLETLVSATAIAARGQKVAEKGESVELSRVLLGNRRIDSRDVVEAAKAGDNTAVKILHEAGEKLGRALGNIFLVLAPERILIGGGVSQAGSFFLAPLRQGFNKTVPNEVKKEPIVFLAELGNDAGMVGLAKYIEMNLIKI